MRDADLIIEGQVPIWRCDGSWKWNGAKREHIDCSRRAIWCEHGVTLGGGHYIGHITCDEHRWRGAITANHTRYWHERLPESLELPA